MNGKMDITANTIIQKERKTLQISYTDHNNMIYITLHVIYEHIPLT
jgi:hypothetical protein